MSRVASIRKFEDIAEEAETNLSNEIHRVYKPDTKVDYQVGASEHDSAWEPYVVVGPYDKFKIVIRGRRRNSYHYGHTIDARSYRIRLTEEKADARM